MKMPSGLTTSLAEERLVQYGHNSLPEQKPPSGLAIFMAQLKNPLVYVLLIAGLVTLVIQHIADASIILLAVFINTILGFFQERKANRALYALKQFVTPKADVIRDNVRQKIDSAKLVLGDVVILAQGSKVPADGEILQANRLYIDEAIVTGESMAVAKQIGEAIYMGTTISAGQALMEVTATGGKTRIGGIAQTIQEVRSTTPLGRQLQYFSEKIVVIILGLAGLVFMIGLIRGNSWMEMFTTVVALAVSGIPEGLLVSMTVVLAIGMQRILRRRGLVRKLASAETLGGVTTICVDKTGTLTQGKMQVTNVSGDERKLAEQVLLANDLDDPLVIAAFEWGKQVIGPDSGRFTDKHDRLDSIPFSSEKKFFTSLNQWTTDSNLLFVNGAPDVLLQWSAVSQKDRQAIESHILNLTAQGKRIIGFAQKEVAASKKTISEADVKQGLKWVGILAVTDPVRPSVKGALQLAKAAGVKIIVITGDYAKTSEFVLSQVGIPVESSEIVTGDELANLSVSELSQQVKTIRLFARTTPEQKLKIVNALKQNGEVVAMMGDGVNDAPAIHKADIGIVVNESSDVARESADLILLDSDFATIVAAIEEGRGIFDNIRKVTLYLLSDAFAEIALVVTGLLFGLPLPITALQIIWINLVSDGFPNLALTIDSKRADIMKEKPRPPRERLISRWMLILISIVSATAGMIAFAVFVAYYFTTGDLVLARSMSFVTLGLNSLVYVFSVRSLMAPFWLSNPFQNRWLTVAVAAGFGLQFLPFATERTRAFFSVSNLGWQHWLLAIGLSAAMFVIVEVFKTVCKIKFVKKIVG